MKWKQVLQIASISLISGLVIVLMSIGVIRSQIQQVAGLAVAQTSIQWNNVKDGAVGDNITNGLLASGGYIFDGTNWDRVRGTGGAINVTAVGTKTPADAYANPTDATGTWALLGLWNGATWDRALSSLHGDGLVAATYPRGLNTTSFAYLFNGTTYDRIRGDTTNGQWVNVKATEKSGTAFYAIKRVDIAAASVNLAFGFTSKKVVVECPGSNTDEVVIDWIGGAAVVPAANTAGDDRVAAGRIVTLDDYAVTSISVIAASGTQTVYVRAWN